MMGFLSALVLALFSLFMCAWLSLVLAGVGKDWRDGMIAPRTAAAVALSCLCGCGLFGALLWHNLLALLGVEA